MSRIAEVKEKHLFCSFLKILFEVVSVEIITPSEIIEMRQAKALFLLCLPHLKPRSIRQV